MVFEDDDVPEDEFWTGCGGWRVDEDDGLGFVAGLVEAMERFIAAIAALLLADTSFVRFCILVFTLTVVVVAGFDRACVVVVPQAWSEGNRCWAQNCRLHF